MHSSKALTAENVERFCGNVSSVEIVYKLQVYKVFICARDRPINIGSMLLRSGAK